MVWADWKNWQKASTIIGVLSGGIALFVTISGGFKSAYEFMFPVAPWDIAPVTVIIQGITPARSETASQKFIVDRTNDTHKTFGTNVKCYDMSFAAKQGFLIKDHAWTVRSATRVSDFSINNDGGKSLKVHFCLKAGPKTDRYRGWLKGDITTTETRKIPQSVDKISEITLKKSGDFELPNKPYATYTRLRVLKANGDIIGTVKLGEQVRFDDSCGTAAIVEKDGVGLLSARCAR